MKRDALVFDSIAPEHVALHARLENWGRWVKGGGRVGGTTSPMFRLYRSSFARSREPEYVAPSADELDGLVIERAVRVLPELQREAIRWCYCFAFVSAFKVARYLEVPAVELPPLVREAKDMLIAARV